ncbi:MAG: FAD-dependent oxidoreductase [Candidatus Magasanikbacteria bacterium]|nr:FAD-dependent oxidoreductase [Candidatus Magasanikbacteria bacterium]
MYDLIVIGGAAVGSAAGIYAARRKLNFLIIAKDLGGEVALSGAVNNWPGIIDIQGFDLAEKFAEHLKSYGVAADEGAEVISVKPEKNYHVVTAKNSAGEIKTYQTKTVIVGTGIHPRELGVPGEKPLLHHGVTSCTVCDGPLFTGKVTATIGAGNSALESALMMMEIASKVYLLTKYPNTPATQGGFPKGEAILIEKVKAAKNVEIIYEANTTEIVGDKVVTGLKYQDAAGQVQQIAVQGVMVHVGMIPNSQFIDCVKKNAQGEIEVDLLGRTSCPGIFAAGDVTNIPYKQIAIAAGQGVTAALTAIDYLNKLK